MTRSTVGLRGRSRPTRRSPQIQSFYHALGFKGKADVHPKRQTVIADAFAQDNSFYSPSDRKIRFGKGGVDDAEDGDVIVHEYGHSIQDAQDRGFGNCNCFQSGALGEGFGDFESAVNTAISPNVPSSYLGTAAYCIFDWDGTGGYGGPGVEPCGRLATGADGDEHVQPGGPYLPDAPGPGDPLPGRGLVPRADRPAGSLPADTRGRPPIVVDVLLSQFIYKDNETFKQAVNALLEADDNIYGNSTGDPGTGAHDAAICAEMKTAGASTPPAVRSPRRLSRVRYRP